MPDAEYDRLFRELQAIEREFPNLQSPDSPTRRVGAEPASALAKHTHRRPMLSLGNAFDADEMAAWQTRIAKLAPAVLDAGYQLELKIDGAAVNLTYERGALTIGATRGNGTVGENITANVRTIPDVPLVLQDDDWPARMEVRGEVYFPLDRFADLNRERDRDGEPPFANPRNAAAGSLRQLDSRITRARGLRFFAFHIETDTALGLKTQHEVLDALHRWGFAVAPARTTAANLEQAHAKIAELEKLIPTLNFQADGVVVKVDRLSLHEELGIVGGREPRWAIARKFAPEVATTTLRRIRINVGRTGALNPYAELEPVEVSGVTVSNATLHNFDLIDAKDIREGDTVEVMRAGEVIPQILGPVRERRGPEAVAYVPPTRCPECSTPVVRPEGEVMVYCPNPECPGRVLESIIHFASRGAMDIRSLGVQRVAQLKAAGLVHTAADLYELTAEQLMALEGFGEKAATQLIEAIANSKKQPLGVLLFALGIRHVGATVASLLAGAFSALDALEAANADEISAVEGVGPVIGKAVEDFFRDRPNREMLQRLRRAGLRTDHPATAAQAGPFTGLTFVVTGTLPTLSRSEATERIIQAGGRVSSSVSGKTDVVVAGESPGTKLEKATKLGIDTIDEMELLRRLGAAT